jgi:hypothetical protein
VGCALERIWSKSCVFHRAEYENEADLEAAILKVQKALFGRNRVYLDIKKKIGAKGGIRNIPDGYLIDLSGRRPRLYVVENELAVHDPLRHIAVQILQFSLSFESEPHHIKKILYDALHKKPESKGVFQTYVEEHDFRNLDHLLEYLVFEAGFSALVIIDSMPEDIENVLMKKFKFSVEVLELARYENDQGERQYAFKPFLSDVLADDQTAETDTSEIDTIVVPARDEGFEEVFIRENRWYKIRIHASMISQIKNIAVYRVAPTSAITHIAPLQSIEPWQDSGKYVLNFSEPAKEIGPIKWVKDGRVKALQNSRYTTRLLLEAAKTLDDIW